MLWWKVDDEVLKLDRELAWLIRFSEGVDFRFYRDGVRSDARDGSGDQEVRWVGVEELADESYAARECQKEARTFAAGMFRFCSRGLEV